MKFRDFLPKTLFLRFLLMIILPTVIIQVVSIYIFYQRHWDVMSKRLSHNLTAEISLANGLYDEGIRKEDGLEFIMRKMQKYITIPSSFIIDSKIDSKKIIVYKKYEPVFIFDSKRQFKNDLVSLLKEQMTLTKQGKVFILQIQKDSGILQFEIGKKRITTITTTVVVLWGIGISLIVSVIAVFFLRNQIKSIKKLSKAAKNFNIGKGDYQFKPTGAREIRAVGVSFLAMRRRIKRFINQRTIMLAAISHDLRTPLTRLKLQLEILKDKDKKSFGYMKGDVEEMENMINAYLSFAKGEQGEEFKKLKLKKYLKSIVSDYDRMDLNVSLDYKTKVELVNIRKYAFKRALTNIINNALKYGDYTLITVTNNKSKILISIEDNGEGVPKEDLKKLSEPFYKADESRNTEKGGVGLGLAIAKDIVNSHSGSLEFSSSKSLGGLRVLVRLPYYKK